MGTPVWTYECGQPPGQVDAHGAPGKVNSGKAWFEEKDSKLIGYLDDGWKCDSEVKILADGFDMETCLGGEKQFAEMAMNSGRRSVSPTFTPSDRHRSRARFLLEGRRN